MTGEDYSERGEQAFILCYFGEKADGIFVDIGALDGIRLSNTRALAERGWSGVYVEPNPSAFDRLKMNVEAVGERHPYVLVDAAVCPTAAEEKVQLWRDDGDEARCSTIKAMERQFLRPLDRAFWVRAITPEQLMFIAGLPPRFDFLAVDAEGCDEWIVLNWPLEICRPRLIMCEVMHDREMVGRLSDHLAPHGYGVVFNNEFNAAWGLLK